MIFLKFWDDSFEYTEYRNLNENLLEAKGHYIAYIDILEYGTIVYDKQM